MSAPHIVLDNVPSLCQKLSDLVEVWRSYNKNNFACFFWDTVYKRDYAFRMNVMEEIFEIRSCIEILVNDIESIQLMLYS